MVQDQPDSQEIHLLTIQADPVEEKYGSIDPEMRELIFDQSSDPDYDNNFSLPRFPYASPRPQVSASVCNDYLVQQFSQCGSDEFFGRDDFFSDHQSANDLNCPVLSDANFTPSPVSSAVILTPPPADADAMDVFPGDADEIDCVVPDTQLDLFYKGDDDAQTFLAFASRNTTPAAPPLSTQNLFSVLTQVARIDLGIRSEWTDIPTGPTFLQALLSPVACATLRLQQNIRGRQT